MPRATRLPLKSLVPLSLGLLGCEADCDVPLKECDADECAVIDGLKLHGNGCIGPAEPAACTWSDAEAASVITPMRGADGSCWLFGGSQRLHGFEPGCPEVRTAPRCPEPTGSNAEP